MMDVLKHLSLSPTPPTPLCYRPALPMPNVKCWARPWAPVFVRCSVRNCGLPAETGHVASSIDFRMLNSGSVSIIWTLYRYQFSWIGRLLVTGDMPPSIDFQMLMIGSVLIIFDRFCYQFLTNGPTVSNWWHDTINPSIALQKQLIGSDLMVKDMKMYPFLVTGVPRDWWRHENTTCREWKLGPFWISYSGSAGTN